MVGLSRQEKRRRRRRKKRGRRAAKAEWEQADDLVDDEFAFTHQTLIILCIVAVATPLCPRSIPVVLYVLTTQTALRKDILFLSPTQG
jgi:hypothetical protein